MFGQGKHLYIDINGQQLHLWQFIVVEYLIIAITVKFRSLLIFLDEFQPQTVELHS